MKCSGYSSQDLHILGVCQSLQGPVLGGLHYDYRKIKDTDSVNRQIKDIMTDAKTMHKTAKGLILSDYNLTAHDMNYLSATLPSHNYNFTIIDFSNNPQIGALGLDYLLKGATGIIRLQSGISDLDLIYQGILSRHNLIFQKLDLSNCNIGDVGADILGHALSNGRLPSLQNIDLAGNNISVSKMGEFLSQISQDIFVITEKSYDEGIAIYKDSSGLLYDMHITSDGKDAVIEFTDGITGISGVSAGDTCPPSIRNQIGSCIGGGIGAVTASLSTCSGTGDFRAKLVCSGGAFLTGCAATIAAVATTQCVSGQEYKDNSSAGFSATGGTEIKGTYIDNDHGLSGSSFDLSQHDF